MYQMPTIDKQFQRGPNAYPSGLCPSETGVAVYGPAASDNPTLSLITPIYDYYGNMVAPGYYELSLSYDKKILYLSQSHKLVATFPVVKYIDNRSRDELKQTMDNKTLKKQEKKKKKEAKKKKEDLRVGKYLTDPPVYSKATIEFDDHGGYYLIKYERGKVEAWGTFKSEF